jgi:hypothetical protein
MTPRVVFAALTMAVIGTASLVVAPAMAQTPEESMKAKAAVQPASDSATPGAVATPTAPDKPGAASVSRSSDPIGSKASLAKPMAPATQ